MRGFNNTKQANSPVLGEVAYQNFIKVAKIKSDKTEEAKKWFKTPAYYFGERRNNGLGADGHIRLSEKTVQDKEQDSIN